MSVLDRVAHHQSLSCLSFSVSRDAPNSNVKWHVMRARATCGAPSIRSIGHTDWCLDVPTNLSSGWSRYRRIPCTRCGRSGTDLEMMTGCKDQRRATTLRSSAAGATPPLGQPQAYQERRRRRLTKGCAQWLPTFFVPLFYATEKPAGLGKDIAKGPEFAMLCIILPSVSLCCGVVYAGAVQRPSLTCLVWQFRQAAQRVPDC